jgi:hypothetical protein
MPVTTRSQQRILNYVLANGQPAPIFTDVAVPPDPTRRETPARGPYRTARMQTGGRAPRRAPMLDITRASDRALFFQNMEALVQQHIRDPPLAEPGPNEMILMRRWNEHLIPPATRLSVTDEHLPTTPWHVLHTLPEGATEFLDDPQISRPIDYYTSIEELGTRNSLNFPGYLERGPYFRSDDLWFEAVNRHGINCFYKLFNDEIRELVRRTNINNNYRARRGMFRALKSHWVGRDADL